jgi:hypothetical protein
LVAAELERRAPERYPIIHLGVPYGDGSRQKCDLALGQGPDWDWLIEVKMLRMLAITPNRTTTSLLTSSRPIQPTGAP